MRFTWLGQAGFLLDASGSRCLFDPFLTARRSRLVDPPVRPEALPGVVAVFVSHEHGDHLDPGPLRRLTDAQGGVRVVLPAPIVAVAVDAGLPPERLLGAVPAGWTDLGGLRFHAV